MKKKYNLFILSRLYLKNYYEYLIKNTNIVKGSDAYSLFIHSMKVVYGLESVDYNNAIDRYGEECIKFLDSLPDTPKNKKNISFEDRVNLVNICEGYAKITSNLTSKHITNNRIKEG